MRNRFESSPTTISVANPDPLLFVPPAGWAVVDEEGTRISFPIKLQQGGPAR
jgi:hypothetical protein